METDQTLITNIIKKLNNKKANGPDNISNKMIKIIKTFQLYLRQFFNKLKIKIMLNPARGGLSSEFFQGPKPL